MRILTITIVTLATALGFNMITSSNANGAPSAIQGATCPTDDARARSKVLRFLVSPNLEFARTEHGVAGIDTASVRVLAAPADTAACRQLAASIELPADPERTAVYYAAGNFLFVSVIYSGTSLVDSTVYPSRSQTGLPEFTPLFLFNAQAEFLDAFGM